MKITSSAFQDGAKIDAKYTVEGQDVSPPIAWSDVPPGSKSFAVICDDPDAPSPKRPADEPWVHWVIFNIPPDVSSLPEGIAPEKECREVPGAKQGINSWPSDNVGYRGPAPPPGSGTHRYFFKVYALDSTLDLDAGATKKQLVAAMSGHILAEGSFHGTYER
jgi:Raf kinase inhibitor-like YbhB/YbcL family protein